MTISLEDMDYTVSQIKALAKQLRDGLYPQGKPSHMSQTEWDNIIGEESNEMAVKNGMKDTTPVAAKLEVHILIDTDIYEDLESNGYSDADIQKAIEQSISLKSTIGGAIVTPPVLDVQSVTLQKYY